MTVSELCTYLQQLPQDMKVGLREPNFGDFEALEFEYDFTIRNNTLLISYPCVEVVY